MKTPSNEIETIIHFSSMCADVGFEILSCSSSAFPDSVIRKIGRVETIRAEFEYKSSSFVEHGHNPYDCDLIICWINDFPIDTGFPIWELSTGKYPFSFYPTNADCFRVSNYIRSWHTKRELRRNSKPKSTTWHELLPTLSPEDIIWWSQIDSGIVKEMSNKFQLSERTMTNWRTNAQNLIKKAQNEEKV